MALPQLDDEPDEPPYREPLPRDDRLWRHPSELADPVPVAPTPIDGATVRPPRRRFLRRR